MCSFSFKFTVTIDSVQAILSAMKSPQMFKEKIRPFIKVLNECCEKKFSHVKYLSKLK